MSILLKLCFLFFVGSVSGWVAELLFRRFFSSANPERKWINPGFCIGPYLPLYGALDVAQIDVTGLAPEGAARALLALKGEDP